MSTPGEYSKSRITAAPADLNSEEAKYFKQTLPRFPNEAIYIYSFRQNRMIYADGWEEILGYPDNEIDMMTIVSITSAKYMLFANELNDKALRFILTQSQDLEKYSFTIELQKIHKDGTPVPIIAKVGVFRSENGRITEIIGRNEVNSSINLGNVMRYAAYGPAKSMFEEELNKELFHHFVISRKEKDALALITNGYSFKEVAHHFRVSQSAIEKRILPLYRRFDVKSLTHLITFAHENHILP